MSVFNYKTTKNYDSKTKTWSGPKFRPYYDENCSFGRIAFEEMRRRSSKICQISDTENIHLTNEEQRLQGIRIARSFEKFGIKQSDIIGIAGRNTTYVFAVVLGCFFHGSAYHAIHPNFDKNTSKLLFNKTKPKLIFCDGQDLEKIRFASNDFDTRIFTLKNHVKGVPSVMELLKPTGDEHFYEPAELEEGPDQNLAILCSSGSTGLPKAVTVPNNNLCWLFMNFFDGDDKIFVLSTLDWLSATFCFVASLVYGAIRIISDKPYSAEYFLEVVEKYQVTSTVHSPPLMAALIKCPLTTPEKLSSIRYYLFGGSSCSLSVQKEMNSLLTKGKIIFAYGFTEIGSAICRNLDFENKPNSVGPLLPGIQARIVNDKGECLGPNEIGEIWCYRDGKWRGYYNDPEASNDIYDENGWFHSGDLGYFDKDNFLYVVERKKELLKYMSMHYYPKEIEDVIFEIPDVKEVCVFGIEEDLVGEKAGAAVVKVEGSTLKENDVIDYVRQKFDADYKHLHAGCKFVNEIPKTSTNKYDRRAARKLFLSQP